MIKIERIHPDAKLPVCAHPGEDLCYDLSASQPVRLHSMVPTLVPTGIKMELPPGWGAIIRPRSGLGVKGIVVGGGEIDNGYRGEIFVLLTLLNGALPFYDIAAGDRIAQFRTQPIYTYNEVCEVESLSAATRGDAGFGSTGR